VPELPQLPALLVDAEWVAAQRASGAQDPSPHPLLEADWIDPTRPWTAERRTGVEWYLADPAHRTRSPHPLFALATLDEQLPSAREHPLGPLGAWLEHVGSSPDAVLPGRPDAPQLTLSRLRELALASLTPDSSYAGTADVSVVLRVGSNPARTVNWLRAVAAVDGLELVAVGSRLARSHRVLAGTVARAYGVRPVLEHDGPDHFAAGIGVASGSRLVLVRGGVVPDAEAALALAGALDGSVDAVQPLLVDRSGVVASAGGLDGDVLLCGHSPRDARDLGRIALTSIVSPVVALTREAAGPGLDVPDWSSLRPGRMVVEPGITMTWASGGLPTPTPTPRAEVREQSRFRWTIDTAAPAGTGGETWGDTHFARSLAAALERRGQHVAVDPAPARDRWSRSLDDVVLVLRGLDTVVPRSDPLHVLWVISHSDEVTAEEARGYGLVFAASTSWAHDRSATWGMPIAPLMQCTDATVFHPGLAEPDSGPAVLFVGNNRGAPRPALAGALAAGAVVEVHGEGWPDLTVASHQVPNTELGRLYASAGVVLNDHWADMRRDGFVSNRLFDAAACGARVLSDDVAGASELFGGLVRTFTDPAEVGGFLAEVPAGWPAYDERVRLAERVAREHSFDRRAETLLDSVAQRLRR
jgi:hypothetical protein